LSASIMSCYGDHAVLHSFPTRRSSDLDALAAFSSRGPAGNFDLLKPDVTAPGVQILAADAGETITGFENLFGLKSGTSMASPHQDRKSTRLNSSHVKISYAVFCLKNKR